MAVIPKAEKFVQTQNKKIEAIIAKNQENGWKVRLQTATDALAARLTSEFCTAIDDHAKSKNPAKKVTVLMAPNLGLYEGIPADVILYGHRVDGKWCERKPLGLEFEAFETLQLTFYKAGWSLIETSDPSRSNCLVFELYPQLLHDVGFNKLWHKHDYFDVKKIGERVEQFDRQILGSTDDYCVD